MYSKNKKTMSKTEREHVEKVKAMPCAVCGVSGPSEAHEIEQGLWFLAIPLCADCHRGSHNGIHGRRSMWNVKKITENSALNNTIEVLYGRNN